MKFELLTDKNINSYIEYLKCSLAEDPEHIWIDSIEEDKIIKRINDKFYQNTKSILAITNNKVVGRIEYHFYGCIQMDLKWLM